LPWLEGFMRRRDFITLLGSAVAWPLAARAQQAAVPVVGFLSNDSPAILADRLRAFHEGLREAGYVEGDNVAILYRWAETHTDRLPALAADLVQRRVTVLASWGTAPGLAAKAATTTIPLVFTVSDDPVRLGLVASLARPGSNATGYSLLSAELTAKRLGLLREMVPRATKVAAILDPALPQTETILRELEAAAPAMGLKLQILKASTSGEINAAFCGARAGAARCAVRPQRRLVRSQTGATGPAGLAPRDTCELFLARIRRSRRADELRSKACGILSPHRRLYGPHP
jgi:putative ABC transport system substrate-binding protein